MFFKKTFFKRTISLTIMLVAAIGATAQQKDVRVYRDGNTWVEEITGMLPAGKGLNVNSAIGAVQVRGGAQANVTYTIKKRVNRSTEEAARRDMANFVVTAAKHGEGVYIEADWPRSRSGRINAEFYVNVPKETSWVKIQTLGGSVGVNNIAGKVVAQTAGGGITLDDIGGAASANTMGGSIDVGHIGGDASLETAGGGIRIGSVGGHIAASTSGGSIQIGTGSQGITVESAGGSISVSNCNGDLRAVTAGGSIDVGSAGAAVHLESMGGGIRLASAKGRVSASTAGGGIRLMKLTSGVQAQTMAGPIEAEFIPGKGGFIDSHLETTMGDIVVYLPSDLGVTLKAAIEMANGHSIISEFDGVKVVKEGGQFGPLDIYAEGRINGGGPVLRLETTNGNIEVRKGKSK